MCHFCISSPPHSSNCVRYPSCRRLLSRQSDRWSLKSARSFCLNSLDSRLTRKVRLRVDKMHSHPNMVSSWFENSRIFSKRRKVNQLMFSRTFNPYFLQRSHRLPAFRADWKEDKQKTVQQLGVAGHPSAVPQAYDTIQQVWGSLF